MTGMFDTSDDPAAPRWLRCVFAVPNRQRPERVSVG